MAVFPLELFEEWDFILAGAHRCQASWQQKTAPDRKDVGGGWILLSRFLCCQKRRLHQSREAYSAVQPFRRVIRDKLSIKVTKLGNPRF
jgi:hypothetical protein